MKPAKKTKGRRPLTREWLLPLPPAHVRDISLKCHMALVALRGNCGHEELLLRLRTSVYLLFVSLDDVRKQAASVELCLEAERVLDACAQRAADGAAWALRDDECAALERVLTAHDTCVATLPRVRLADLWRHVCAFAASGVRAPLAMAVARMREHEAGGIAMAAA
ncbi:hypothetical protein [Burkholderia stagnalis]|uniref:hypothetical protein n=1 Tax=Burkholderia stagnalis TaxID=1503054 RepID=UPI0007576D83|nr:hypothetical protein [Burkholderia stagnalis]AOK57654.1 hypothetical protein WT74_32435 [Burkholderia stagnalis]KVC68766.1 hypothetical protein WS59_07425 [Burkholderia stagnalis]KVN12385.1 hypothetical protein WT10_27780 [Burkholderia stagnalis]KVN72073.1 hypothetical protein WT15_27975 [Burkholderia stagnalis]KVX65213.1 hypothetical protein WT33_09710 [Burkholderia stagnalis]